MLKRVMKQGSAVTPCGHMAQTLPDVPYAAFKEFLDGKEVNFYPSLHECNLDANVWVFGMALQRDKVKTFSGTNSRP